MAVTERPVSIGEGSGRLFGTLALPEAEGRFDAILIWSGSGPTDRDGNSPGGLNNNSLKMLAHALAESGFASIRTDKRGIGESRPAMGREEALRFETFVDDAVRWAKFLKELPRVRYVSLLGHSEGALDVTLAAKRFRPGGLVLISGAGFPAADVLRRQIAEPGVDLPEPFLSETHGLLRAMEEGRIVDTVSPELLGAYRPTIQPYLISWFAHDPATALGNVSVPTLVIQGTTDLQTSTKDAERLKAARDGIRLVKIDGMNHVLKTAPSDREENYATYFKPMLPLSTGLIPPVLEFLRRATVGNDR